MNIIETKIPGAMEITLLPHEDDRGFFMRTYDVDLFKDLGLDCNWVQENHSFSRRAGIIRGLHFQFPPYGESKLIRVVRGAVFDVFVDLRKGSPSFGQWGAVELNEDNNKMVFLPRGLAHGFCTLKGTTSVVYKVDNFYRPEAEGGIIWDDRDIKIDWPTRAPQLSKKDSGLISFQEFKEKYGGI
jgi:dTDP-4-dehydrorhamnose 3,5-epimerase